jgi:molybdenum cofactor cytidylyltransferase
MIQTAGPRGRLPDFGAQGVSPMIAIIVLAAGKSSRAAPQNKLLTAGPSGSTLIEQTVDHAVASHVGPVTVVTGYQAEQVRQVLMKTPVRFVYAADFAEGIAASLRTGIATLDSDIQGALICLGDMPLVAPSTMRQIAGAYDAKAGREIIIPTFEGRRGNPVLWGRRFFPRLLQLTGDRGAREILAEHMEFAIEIPVTCGAIRVDFDTPEELATFNRLPD